MFEEIDKLLLDLSKQVNSTRLAATYAGDYFRALALIECYNKLIEFADSRTQQHPEVQRVPELRTVLLAHLMANADRHIDTRTERIFNPLILGSPKSLRDWQESGWRTKRSSANYKRRLDYWKAIYDEAPLIHQQRVRSGGDLFGDIVQQAVFSTRRISRRVKDLQGNISHKDVSYEQIIAERNANYSATSELVPWWEALNYGTAFTGVAGYPNVAGLHFVEDAEKLVPSTINRYLNLFEAYIADVFVQDRIITSNEIMYDVERWIRPFIRSGNEYVPAADLARIVTFGVPF